MKTTLNINGELKNCDADLATPLLYILRNDLELNGAKFGCGAGQCGACTVLMNNQPIRSCVTLLRNIPTQAKITTIEGLSQRAQKSNELDSLSILQNAFIEEQAAQCGYCINGMIMTAKSFLDKNPDPTDNQIRGALDANLCRCGTHSRILKAVKRAALQIKQSKSKPLAQPKKAKESV